MDTITIDGRMWEIVKLPGNGRDHLRDHLLGQGFDGDTYHGTSKPVGRQRKTYSALFFKSAKSNKYVFAI